MNPGQEKFYQFILGCTKEGQEEAVKELLMRNFDQQAAGTFGLAQVMETREFLKDKIKPECMEQVNQVMEQFGKNI